MGLESNMAKHVQEHLLYKMLLLRTSDAAKTSEVSETGDAAEPSKASGD